VGDEEGDGLPPSLAAQVARRAPSARGIATTSIATTSVAAVHVAASHVAAACVAATCVAAAKGGFSVTPPGSAAPDQPAAGAAQPWPSSRPLNASHLVHASLQAWPLGLLDTLDIHQTSGHHHRDQLRIMSQDVIRTLIGAPILSLPAPRLPLYPSTSTRALGARIQPA